MRFDKGGHIVIPLRIISGPAWDTTLVYCTCGWKKTYKTSDKATRKTAKHMADHEAQESRSERA